MNAKRPVADLSVSAWLKHAESDLRLAQLARHQDILPEQICFHAQQAVEKSLKALLIHAHIDFPFTHDLRELLDVLGEAGISIPDELGEVDILTPFAVETRYPGFWGAISEDDVDEAITFAVKTVRWVQGHVAD
jgi:HEPN domain-containing protein